MAFDTANAGSCTREAFEKSVDAIIAAGWCDIDARDLDLLYSYLFPRPWTLLGQQRLAGRALSLARRQGRGCACTETRNNRRRTRASSSGLRGG